MDNKYAFYSELPHTDYESAIGQVTLALKDEGFGVLTTIDVKETLKTKLDVDFRPYSILGACNPVLANQALGGEPLLGVLLPCNVVVMDRDGGGSIVVETGAEGPRPDGCPVRHHLPIPHVDVKSGRVWTEILKCPCVRHECSPTN